MTETRRGRGLMVVSAAMFGVLTGFVGVATWGELGQLSLTSGFALAVGGIGIGIAVMLLQRAMGRRLAAAALTVLGGMTVLFGVPAILDGIAGLGGGTLERPDTSTAQAILALLGSILLVVGATTLAQQRKALRQEPGRPGDRGTDERASVGYSVAGR